MAFMNAQDPAVAGLFIFTDDGHNGENAAVAGNDGFSDMLRDFDYFTEDDLFELMWQGGASCFEQPASPVSSYLRLSPAPAQVPAAPQEIVPVTLLPETLDQPAAAAPSEEEMAAWLYPIVSGEVAGGRTEADDGRRGALPEKETMEHRPGGLMTTDAASDDSGERKKQVSSSAAGARTRSHHAAGAHNLTEKRRRFKITERLRTLQRLVPGCDKSNQASTLDQTIQYMKSLQHQLKAMSVVPPPPTAVYPAVHPQYMPPPPPAPAVTMPMPAGMVIAAAAAGPPPPMMVPLPLFGAMLPYTPYPTVLLPAAPLY